MMPIPLPFPCHGSTIQLIFLRIEERPALPIPAGAVTGKVAGIAQVRCQTCANGSGKAS